jgi:putative transposase
MSSEGNARSTFYDRPAVSFDDTALVERMVAISDNFEACGYRRMQAALLPRTILSSFR